jgi:Nitroreductase family
MPPDLAGAVTHALRAPSVHNTQPWRWRIHPGAVELHADPRRQLDATDPDRRDLILSCGAALHHLRVTLAATGHAIDVDILPDPENRDHLATVRVRPGAPDAEAGALYTAIERRRTDRRRLSHTPIDDAHARTLAEAARTAGGLLVPVDTPDMRRLLLAALDDAAQRQAFVPGYAAELRMWSSRYAAARDGIPAGNIARDPVGLVGSTPLRRFPHGTLHQPADLAGPRSPDDAASLFVLATAGDGVADRLRAGEATSAVLLTATRLGLATTPLSQGIEIRATRELLRHAVLRIPEQPQLLLRIGRPASDAEDVPASPRRDLRSVLLPG